jgi:hypothetical protein
MTGKSAFSDDEWRALSEAPLSVAIAMAAVSEHGPISMVKEAAASARLIAHPGPNGPASELIDAIAEDARGHEARHDAKEHRGKSFDEAVDEACAQLAPAAAALTKVPADEAEGVRHWLVEIARAVAAASKGTSDREQTVVDRISAALAPPAA